MAIIKPCADLRNNYSKISEICHTTNKPIYITKNGYNDLVILSTEAYEKLTEDYIDKCISKKFDKHYRDFEDFKKAILNKINIALQEIQNGNEISMKDALSEMEAKYDL